MPFLAIIYVLVVACLALDTLRTDLKERTPKWFATLNLIAIASLIVLFSSFWVPTLLQSIRLAAPIMFLFSLIWELCTARRGIDRIVRAVSSESQPLVRRWAMGLEVIVGCIGYWYGGAAVLRIL